MNHFPESTTVRVTLDRLIAREGNRQLSQRLSSRMVKCASVLEREEHLGWQLLVPEKGLVRMELFGSGALRRDDLEWMAEEMARTGSGSLLKDSPLPFSEVYELYLPVAEERGTSTIGFGASGQRKEETIGWPWGCPVQFGELIGALRRTGGMFRGVIGPACREEQLLCQKNTLRTFDAAGIDPREYIGRPVRARFLFRFPQAPSIRLRAVLEEAAPGAKLRYLGTMDQPKARQVRKQLSSLTTPPAFCCWSRSCMRQSPGSDCAGRHQKRFLPAIRLTGECGRWQLERRWIPPGSGEKLPLGRLICKGTIKLWAKQAPESPPCWPLSCAARWSMGMA